MEQCWRLGRAYLRQRRDHLRERGASILLFGNRRVERILPALLATSRRSLAAEKSGR